MIFKRFFKPKWQHPDAAVRQQAIQTLDQNDQQHKAVLHELAFNDGAEAVRKAALMKLNDFSLWWQASKHDSAERLQTLAEQTLVSQLLQNKVEPKLKQQFIAQCNRSSILEQLAQTETDAQIKFGLLQRLNKADLNHKALQDPVLHPEQKRQLLSSINDEKTLEKLAKQLDGDMQREVQAKLRQLHEARQKPLILRKQLTLFLAKLNALRERSALESIPAQLADYQAQWAELDSELVCLGDEALDYRAKYTKIVNQLQQWLTPRLAAFEEQQAVAKQHAAAQQAKQAIADRLSQLEQQLQQTLLSADINAAQQLELQLSQVADTLSQFNTAEVSALSKRLAQLQQQLAQLPQLAEQLAQLTRIVADWAAITLPQTAEQYFQHSEQLQTWQSQWRRVSKAMLIQVPQSLQQAQTALALQWQELAKAFTAQSEKAQRQCRSKLAQFKRLYDAGKFKVLFGLFKGIEQDYQQLPEAVQASLSKDFEFARDKMAELADWQEYIATPRKQQLLAELQQLPAELNDKQIRQRADEVKRARAVWNSLGKAKPELETQLNADFDAACEQAFAPCRRYFAQQDALRAQHVQQRQQLIEQARNTDVTALDAKAIDQLLKQLIQAWQQAGAVDKQQFSSLNDAFSLALQPLKQQLNQLRQQVADVKQQLIDKARAAIELTDANVSSKILKECQQQWKTAGTAERKRDQALWLEFRAICDAFFSARSAQLEAQKHAEQAELQQVTVQLQQLQRALAEADSPLQLQQLELQLRDLQPQGQSAVQAVRSLTHKLQEKALQLTQQAQSRDLDALFSLLADPALTAEQLPAQYREYFAQQQEQQLSRAQLTLALEIVANVTSPEQEQSQRQQVQLMLLSDKHNQGAELDKLSLLKRWLQFGAVSEAEQPLLQRIQRLF